MSGPRTLGAGPSRTKLRKPARLLVLPFAIVLGVIASCGGGDGGSGGSEGGNSAGAPSTVGTTTAPPAGTGAGSGSGTVGSESASISANESTLAVTAGTAESAPSATISVTAQISGTSEIYVGVANTNNGIASVSAVGGLAANITLTFKSPAVLGAGTYQDTVSIYGCYDQACTRQVANSPLTVPVTYTVTLQSAQITSLVPNSTPAGGAGLTLQLTGTGFTAQSVVEWYGTPLPTTYIGPTQLSAQLDSTVLAIPDIAQITVTTANPANETSLPATFVVTGVSPSVVTAGESAFNLTAIGTGFTSSSTVQWNGSARPTTFVSANVLRAQIGANDIATAGTIAVAVPSVGGSSALASSVTVTSTPASKDAVAFQIDPQHSGAISFNSVSLPTAPAWSVDVGGAPSFALIASGEVFVASVLGGGGPIQSELLALDQTSGATVWGPISISGVLNLVYDNGTVFVSNGAEIQAYDAQSGNMQWSAAAPASLSFLSLAAANGRVFASGENGIGTIAYFESNGVISWLQPQSQSGTDATVTLDGLVLGDVGVTFDLDPATGDIIWQNNGDTSGGHNVIAAAVNGVLYSPNTLEFGSDNGTEFNIETGAVLGGFNAYYPAAIGAQTGYFLTGSTVAGGTLSAVNLGTSAALWTFTGDGQLMTSPILVDSYVFIASSSGNIYGLDATSGAVVWQQNAGAAIAASPGWGAGIPRSGLSAGDGLLVVPAGTHVTAYTLSTSP
jgi:outer membrane protein assembly factor BamB